MAHVGVTPFVKGAFRLARGISSHADRSGLPAMRIAADSQPRGSRQTPSHADRSGLPATRIAADSQPCGSRQTPSHADRSGLPATRIAADSQPCGSRRTPSHADRSGLPATRIAAGPEAHAARPRPGLDPARPTDRGPDLDRAPPAVSPNSPHGDHHERRTGVRGRHRDPCTSSRRARQREADESGAQHPPACIVRRRRLR